MINYTSNRIAMIIVLTVGLIKWINHFPDLYTRSKSKIKVELYFSNNTTKFNLKKVTGVDTSKFAKKTDLVNYFKIKYWWIRYE